MNWVELTRVNSITDAYALRTYLEAHDVDVLIPNEHTTRNMDHIMPALGGFVQLKVLSTALEEAQVHLREYNLNNTSNSIAHDDDLPEELKSGYEPIKRDEVAKRALRAAIFGALIVPVILNLYSLKLLHEIYTNPKLLKDSKHTDLSLAMIFNIIGIIIWSSFGYFWYLDVMK